MDEPRSPRPAEIVAIVGTLLLGIHLLWYRTTPMGQFPVMDGHYNLALAVDLARGTLAPEPFFRAPLYPFLLSLPLHLGLPESALPDFARLLNFAAFLGATIGLLRLLERAGAGRWGAALGMGLFALNPVLHFYAGDPYDILLATALMVGFLRYGWETLEDPRARLPAAAAAASFLAVGFTLRSHFLPLAVAWPGVLATRLVWMRWRGRALPLAAATLLPMAAMLLLSILGSWLATGQARAQPWQGPFMLYVTNHPDLSNGYTYAQQVDVSTAGEGRFPVEEEARQLYLEATGAATFTVEEANAFFRAALQDAIRADPLGWAALPLQRLYGLLNHFEQYDNKTWPLQKPLQPLLRWNPLGWGLLLVGAGLGLVGLWRRNPTLGALFLLTTAGYSVVIVLVLANGRYRLPLYPVLALAAAFIPQSFAAPRRSALPLALGLGLVAAVITFSRFAGVAATDTRAADYVLMAHAAQQAGDDHATLRWAEEAEAHAPGRVDVAELRLSAGFNLALAGGSPVGWDELLPAADRLAAKAPDLAPFLVGYARFRTGDPSGALDSWSRGILHHGDAPDPDCLAALMFFNPGNPQLVAMAEGIPHPTPLLHAVRRHDPRVAALFPTPAGP